MKIRLLLSLPLALVPALAPHARVQAERPTLASPRDELTAVQARWGAARTSHDAETFEALLAPGFFVQIGPTRMSRQEFIAEISEERAGARLTRFDADILTLVSEGDVWVAVIAEKLEFTVRDAGGAEGIVYSLWVTKDSFRKDAGAWTILSSEALGTESWAGGRTPPFPDWSS